MAQNWAADMRLFIKTCSNLEVLSVQKQRTLCKKFVKLSLWSQIEFFRGDDMKVMIKRVEEAFNRLQPLFSRKIKFLDLKIMLGEGYVD